MRHIPLATPCLVALMVTAAAPLASESSLATGASGPAGAPSGWADQVQRNLQQQEYELTWQDHPVIEGLGAAWHAPNRAHGLRSYFVEEGIRVVPRMEEWPSWVWSLSLVGYGRGTTLWPVEKPRLAVSQNRIDYGRGMLEEWYVNDPRGLKQGFLLKAPPEEAAMPGAGVPFVGRVAPPGRAREIEPESLIHLDLKLVGELMPVVSADGQAIDFVVPGGARAVRYAELVVTDARGKTLPAWMEGMADETVRGIRLVVDDTEATYPITIDPLATSPAWTAESDQAVALFGRSVGTAGDVNGDGYADVIVGAYAYDNGQSNEGRAFAYLGSASGLSGSPSWAAESDQADAYFGHSVGTAGDVNGDGYADVIVGAYFYDNGQHNEGRAFAYLGSASGLSLSPSWMAESDQASAQFGFSVGTAGDVNGDGYSDVIVSAVRYDNVAMDEGRAYAYLGSASGLSVSSSWTAETGQASAVFGVSVGTAGDVNRDGYADVIVGAHIYDNGQEDEGRAYAYLGSASGLSLSASWTVESDQAGGQFGVSVGTAGDVNGDGYADVIVGAVGYNNGQAAEGRAYAYLGSASGLLLSPSWTAESDQAGAYLGVSVGTAGDVNGDGYADVIVGAYFYDKDQSGEGRAFAYLGSASGLSLTSSWTAESNQVDARFGVSVGTAGDVNGDGYADVIVGAEQYSNGQSGEGRAFAYLGSGSGLSGSPSWTAEPDQAGAGMGVSVGTAGDVNGDGYADVIVGAYLYDEGETNEGRAFVYLGSASGLSLSPAWTAQSDQAGALFGFSVGTAGDINGDGFADVLVGAFGYDNRQTDEGRAYAYLGSAAGLLLSPSWTAESDQADAFFGVSVGTAGDVNGDGYADVIVGAYFFDNGEVDEGGAFVYPGSTFGLSLSSSWRAEGNQAGARFGNSVGAAGDVNRDGYADVIVGAYIYDNGQEDEGRAYAYLGSASGLSLSPSWMAESDQASAQFGFSVGTAGDVNGDGYSDVIVSAVLYDNVAMDEGRAYAYLGSATGLSVSPSWTAETGQASAVFGYSVGTAGDVNGDGYADVIVGAYAYDNVAVDEGRAYAYLGSASGLSLSPSWVAESDQGGALFGYSVGTAGDVNGDGCADVIVGAFGYDNVEGDEGRAFLYYGNGGAGLGVKPQQRRADNSAPIAHGGRSLTQGSFRLAVLGRTPFGRGRVRLEWEVKRRGLLFDGTGTQRSVAWQDTGTAGVSFNQLVSGLEPGGYHWRVRLLYDPATSPFQQASRWFTVPWNGWEETDLVVSPFIGGLAWDDRDQDGIRNAAEPPSAGVTVQLLDSVGATIQQTATNGAGGYSFDILEATVVRVRFIAPSGYQLTLQNQGTDDTQDSDADRVTGETTLIGPPHQTLDATSWSAGLVRQCFSPADPIFINGVRLDVNSFPILDFQDGNQPSQVTGYHVYRSSNAAIARGSWPRVTSNVLDMDAATLDVQWVDSSGAVSPSGIWYYNVTAYNSICDAEGPF